MSVGKRIFFLASACVFLGSCAERSSLTREPEKVIVEVESHRDHEELAGELKALKMAIASLRTETERTERVERALASVRADLQRLRVLDRSLSGVRSDLENLKGLESRLLSLEGEVEKTRAFGSYVSILRGEVSALEKETKALQFRPPLTVYRLPPEVVLCGERFPGEDRNIWENLDREFLLAIGSDAQILLWMKRARRYFPHVEKKLREMGLPDDLKYLAIVESSLRPYAVSSSGAAGIWQFIPSTGEKFEMRKGRGIDERFDFFKATEGALSYLKGLYEEFGSWFLAMAAYNAGENRVRKEIKLQETSDYFYLDLPMETERYVYKIGVMKIILSNPGQYGFHLDEKEYYDPLAVERVRIEVSQPLPIVEVARAVGAFYKEIRELNPHLTEEAIPSGIHFLNLPPGTSERFRTFLSAWKKEGEKRSP